MRSSLFSLIVVCFGVLVLSKSSTNQVDKYSYIIDALARPYSNAYQRIRDNTASGFKNIQSMFVSGLSDDSKEEKSRLTINAVKDTDFDNEEDTNDSFRNLQTSCSSLSQSVSTQVNVYTCDGTEVSKTDYDNLNGEGCTVTTETKNLCYCRYDYYGDTCQTLNSFSCEIERTSHPENCEGVDSFTYVYSFSGTPPCYKVQAGDTVVYKTKATCSYFNTQYNFEGVKHSKYEVITQPTITPSPFTYAISNDRIHATSQPTQVMQTISFTNWKKMATPISYTTTLTLAQIEGDDEIVTNINFGSSLVQAATSGRYYFEIAITTTGSPQFVSRSYNGGYFEQAGYQEPSSNKKSYTALIIVLSVLGAVLLIGIIIGYRFYQKRKDQLAHDAAEAVPLVANE